MNTARTQTTTATSPIAVLLNLSGDKNAASEWAASHLGGEQIRTVEKADLKWSSKGEALKAVRALKPQTLSIFVSDLSAQSELGALMIFAVFAGARRVLIGDAQGRTISRSRLGAMLLEAPRFAAELLVGYAFVIPASLLITGVLAASLAVRGVLRSSRIANKDQAHEPRSLKALYVCGTLSTAAEGGMRTHVKGFSSGAASLGHRLKFLVSGAGDCDNDLIVIKPSSVFTATRALFELWNNLVFTVKSLRLVDGGALRSSEFDVIYQRYGRFNWTGVALSIVTGLPLLLEFNGSEVWVAKEWDPIGQLRMLKMFERLNQRAADLIFVVSNVARRNLVRAGVKLEKIVVNPNGVDASEFSSGSGGHEIRRTLGVEDKVVIGFIGTFGPWHGAPVLAEAAYSVSPVSRCHFLFIGDGEQRAQTESIVKASGVNATFTGRVSHEKAPAYLDACDILVAPHVAPADGSEFFGSPTKLFEYLAMGKAIVGSRLGQIAEVIADGENGLLVEPGNPEQLARAIEQLARDEETRTRLGLAARQTAIEKYTWRHNAARVFDVLQLIHS